MPAFYEVIYETGEHSIMQADSDEEALEGIKAQHQRAMKGELGGAEGTQWPATRIKRVLVYDTHPQDLYESGSVDVGTLDKWVADAVKRHQMGDLVSVNQVIASLRDGLNALDESSGPHESNYKMKEARELKEASWQS